MKKNIAILLALSAMLLCFPVVMTAQVGSSRVVSAKKLDVHKVAKEKPTYAPVERGWQNIVKLQYNTILSIGLHYEGGYRFGKAVMFGMGVGYNFDIYNNWHYFQHRVPIYAQAKFFFIGERRVNPFIGISQGADMLFYSRKYYDGRPLAVGEYTSPSADFIAGGSHTRIELGCNIRITPQQSLLISAEMGTSPYASDSWGRVKHALMGGFNVGYIF